MISTPLFSPSAIAWTPCNDPLPDHPYLARILDGKARGFTADQSVFGHFAAGSMSRLQRSVEKRNPWRAAGFRSSPVAVGLAKWLRNLNFSYSRVSAETGKSFHMLRDYLDFSGAVVDLSGSRDDVKTRKHLLSSKFGFIQSYVNQIYTRASERQGEIEAQKRLDEIEQRLTLSGSAGLGSLLLTENEEKLAEFAKKTALYLAHLIYSEHASSVVISYVKNKRKGIVWKTLFPSEAALNIVVSYLGYTANEVAEKCDPERGWGIQPLLSRLKSHDFILRRFRAIKRLALADFLRESGFVSRKRETFVADALVSDRKWQKQRNDDLLKNLVIYDQDDLDNNHELWDIICKSTNNPANRFYELLARFKGFAEFGEESGFSAGMFTLTTPSRFHAVLGNGRINPKWDAAGKPTVLDSSAWLCDSWALIQARCAKHDIRPFGFKFIEPHHDGTVHYHVALWYRDDDKAQLLQIFRDVMLREYEPGANEHRFNFIEADKSKGAKGMIGYFLPYIAKNTSGRKLDGHDEFSSVIDSGSSDSSVNAVSPVERVDTWKCDYRLRQFAQIGGPSVSIWREFRRMRNEFIEGSGMFAHLTKAEHFLLESIRRAADASDWKAFCIAMGGIHIKRRYRPVSISYNTTDVIDKLTGELDERLERDFRLTRHGDIAAAQLNGLKFRYVRDFTEINSDGGFVVSKRFHELYIKTRTTQWQTLDKEAFKKFRVRGMDWVSEMFHVLKTAEQYEEMANEEFERIQRLQDEAESAFERQINIEFYDMPEHQIISAEEYFESRVCDDLAYSDEGWLAQGAALS